MKDIRTRKIYFVIFLLFGALLIVHSQTNQSKSAAQQTYELELTEKKWELRPGLFTTVWAYNGQVPGTPIIASPGDSVTIKVKNKLLAGTNIHWHGLEVPNDQDGPEIRINSKQTHTYNFTLKNIGTYWYHPHKVPILEQLDKGLYGAFIIKAPEDAKYTDDQTFILDDWLLSQSGERRPFGTARGMMERFGNLETINGKTGKGIKPLLVKQGGLYKLRFINASTAAVHTLVATGHPFRVTHNDGRPLQKPYMTDTITLQPGERIDVELSATGKEGDAFTISSTRPEFGMVLPVKYEKGKLAVVESPYVIPQAKGFSGIFSKKPDYTYILNSGMTMPMRMIWSINGKIFPNVPPLKLKINQVVKLRFTNKDVFTMHPMDHAIHVHGTAFQVVSINGKAPEAELWRDTMNVPAGEYLDIAFKISNPGSWMLHCHVIDHEDNGMAMMVEVKG